VLLNRACEQYIWIYFPFSLHVDVWYS
jgi:hypothetical protein